MNSDVSSIPTMAITDQLFEAFLHCPTKCFLLAHGEPPTDSVYADWVRQQSKSYQKTVTASLMKRLSPIGPLDALLDRVEAMSANWRCATDLTVRSQHLESHLHAVERVSREVAAKATSLVPIRAVRANRPNKVDKLMLAFDALVLSEITERQVPFGRIIHGDDHTSIRIKTATNQVKDAVERIWILLQTKPAPDLVLNRHCVECEFRGRCRKKAVEIDELSLFSGMSPEERVRHRRKGIFTINQLSYTFRPRRDPKGEKRLARPHYFALQALAIRENTIYVHGSPQLPDAETCVYLDIEGLSTSGPYYLAGVLVVARGREEFHSLWARQRSDEITIFTEFVEMVSQLPDFRVFHYGAYDMAALKLVRPKLAEHLRPKIDLILQRSVNVLSLIHQHVYFPTYTNGLKDVGQLLGYGRAGDIPNGLHSIIWRRSWEANGKPEMKEALLRYNRDDCFALRHLSEFIKNLAIPNTRTAPKDLKIARADAITAEKEFRVSFGPKKFALADLEHVTKCAYFDYHREKVLFRTHPHLKPRPKTSSRIDPKKLRPNTTIVIQDRRCPNCGTKRVERTKLVNYFLVDLKFMRSGVRKFITKFSSWRCLCLRCDRPFSTGDTRGNAIKFGRSLRVWCTYWNVVRGLQLDRIRRSLQDLFEISIQTSSLCRFRRTLSLEYRRLYEDLLKNILLSPVMHIDETTVHLPDTKGYVWVMTSLDAVFFLYRPNREGGFLAEMLRPFTGVLVSDFYAVYDSLGCRQQKCLVHFVRDIDDDLLKNPLDEELKTMAQEFSVLLKQIIQSVDRFGLKKRHLQKHRKPVNKFLRSVQSRELCSPVANSYKQRFEKTGAKMFTFLDYDGVPWNNNYAEHAIKRFAKYRRVFDGLYTEDSLTEYLILASVLNTCELNNVNALTFLISGEKSFNGLRRMAQTNSRKQSRMPIASLSEPPQRAWAEAPDATSQNPPIIHISCTDSNWKERCRTHLRARQEIELTDFDADVNRNWGHQQAARHGGRCNVRKRSRHAFFRFAPPI